MKIASAIIVVWSALSHTIGSGIDVITVYGGKLNRAGKYHPHVNL
jgi:hypothetical protein